jgi:hypothetical protein
MAAESIISPGVFMQENDNSQITQGPIQVGAAIIGPTVIGPVNRPTVVTSYSDFKAVFGALFTSGGRSYEYLTSIAVLNYFEQGGNSLLVTRVGSSSYSPASAIIYNNSSFLPSFELETLSYGTVMNNATSNAVNGALPSGSTVNVRWEVTGMDSGSGVFSINIRRGDDYNNFKTVLESWNNLSLDPNQNNYIEYVIGDQSQTVQYDEYGLPYLQFSGSYMNKSKYVRVKKVYSPTPNYFNSYGQPANLSYMQALPAVGSGSFNGGFGFLAGESAEGPLYGTLGISGCRLKMFEEIPNVQASQVNNIQGLVGTDYQTAIGLLYNKDAYSFNVIYAPGLNSNNASSEVNAIVQLAEDRGDCIAVVDMVGYGEKVSSVTTIADQYDNSYAATYWPWIQIRSRETGKMNFVPASTLIPAVYEFNDKISAEWYAPAGLNRGGLTVALQPERRLSQADRDILYQGKVNPIASFPGVGTVVYGQKTLQKRASALDRVNVRRLLIALKSYIGQIGETLVFEPNTQVTRNKFLNQVNPYLEYVQQRQGLYAFQVVMDETNNTPDVIDRNQLVGTIYLQPTRVAEFITLDFNILPTGATFS